MKGYFISIGKSVELDTSGIGQKVKNQIKAFNKSGLNCSELVLPVKESRFLSILYRLPYSNVLPVWNYYYEFSSIDYIYMRRPFVMNCHMRRVLKKIREHNSNIKIIVELPTYPYDAEYGTYKFKWMLLLKDKYNRIKMKRLVNYFAILTDENEVFGVPTIKIENGIDVESITPKKYNQSADTINVCAVAMFKEWHGYERFFYGLKEYYANGGQRKIICHFVGEGSELDKYKKIVKKECLEQYVKFYGYLDGASIERIYDISSIALGSFGMYKININFACNLKSREAVARGIPMVTGCPTDIFNKGYKYYLEFPNDSSILDIQKIIDFHDQIYSEERGESIIANIRNYAYETVDMNKCMSNVIEYLKN